MSKKYCMKCNQRKPRTKFRQQSAICNDCQKQEIYGADDKPSCECGGKVVSAQKMGATGQSLRESYTYVYMCCGCGKELGIFKDDALTPRMLLRAMYEESAYNRM